MRHRIDSRAMALGLALAVLSVTPFLVTHTRAEGEKVTITGKIEGGQYLLNPVWTEAADVKQHRFTFRAPSPTVSKNAKVLRAYLPKELCVVALKKTGKGEPKGAPVQIGISGGRTTPVTLVVPEGQNVQFVNHDPFPHKLYDVAGKAGGLGPEETRVAGQRIWKPPAPGVYEIRDQLFPSVRSWIVVEPRAASAGFVNLKGELAIPDLEPGDYTVQGYFMGKPVGDALPVSLRGTPAQQPLPRPLVVGKKGK